MLSVVPGAVGAVARGGGREASRRGVSEIGHRLKDMLVRVLRRERSDHTRRFALDTMMAQHAIYDQVHGVRELSQDVPTGRLFFGRYSTHLRHFQAALGDTGVAVPTSILDHIRVTFFSEADKQRFGELARRVPRFKYPEYAIFPVNFEGDSEGVVGTLQRISAAQGGAEVDRVYLDGGKGGESASPLVRGAVVEFNEVLPQRGSHVMAWEAENPLVCIERTPDFIRAAKDSGRQVRAQRQLLVNLMNAFQKEGRPTLQVSERELLGSVGGNGLMSMLQLTLEAGPCTVERDRSTSKLTISFDSQTQVREFFRDQGELMMEYPNDVVFRMNAHDLAHLEDSQGFREYSMAQTEFQRVRIFHRHDVKKVVHVGLNDGEHWRGPDRYLSRQGFGSQVTIKPGQDRHRMTRLMDGVVHALYQQRSETPTLRVGDLKAIFGGVSSVTPFISDVVKVAVGSFGDVVAGDDNISVTFDKASGFGQFAWMAEDRLGKNDTDIVFYTGDDSRGMRETFRDGVRFMQEYYPHLSEIEFGMRGAMVRAMKDAVSESVYSGKCEVVEGGEGITICVSPDVELMDDLDIQLKDPNFQLASDVIGKVTEMSLSLLETEDVSRRVRMPIPEGVAVDSELWIGLKADLARRGQELTIEENDLALILTLSRKRS